MFKFLCSAKIRYSCVKSIQRDGLVDTMPSITERLANASQSSKSGLNVNNLSKFRLGQYFQQVSEFIQCLKQVSDFLIGQKGLRVYILYLF